MPSWNIHIAHVERLLAHTPLEELGIRDANAFLFGNVAPDVYVGYMVANPTKKIDYKDTHFANPDFIPAPNASRFFELYVQGRDASDLTLGAWTHLLCDHYYNRRTIEYIASIGVAPGEQTRIRKQADFDVFGRTLCISSVPVANDALLAQCAAFEQYAIDERDARAAIEVTEGIVCKNAERHVTAPQYSLLTKRFFEDTFAEVDDALSEGMRLWAAGGDPTHLGRA